VIYGQMALTIELKRWRSERKQLATVFKEKQKQSKQVCKVMSKVFILNMMATCSRRRLFVLRDVFAVLAGGMRGRADLCAG
jgi:hypothetical protein